MCPVCQTEPGHEECTKLVLLCRAASLANCRLACEDVLQVMRSDFANLRLPTPDVLKVGQGLPRRVPVGDGALECDDHMLVLARFLQWPSFQ